MSVLLEALKKAAEEKKRSSDILPDSAQNQLKDSTSSLKLSTVLPESVTNNAVIEPSKIDIVQSEVVPVSELELEQKPDTSDDTMITVSPVEDKPNHSLDLPSAIEVDLDMIQQEPPVVLNSGQSSIDYQKSLRVDSLTSMSLGADSANLPKNSTDESDDKDSFEWSMYALPGYSSGSFDNSKPLQENPILLSGAHTSAPKKSKKIQKN